eukprot:gene9761-1963_t
MIKTNKEASKPEFRLDCDRFAAEQFRQRHVSNVYKLTREERLRIIDPDYQEPAKNSRGFVLDGERYSNSHFRSRETFPYKPFLRKNRDPSNSNLNHTKYTSSSRSGLGAKS